MSLSELLDAVIGPWGALAFALVVCWVLYRLFREKDRSERQAWDTVREMTEAMNELTRVVAKATGDER